MPRRDANKTAKEMQRKLLEKLRKLLEDSLPMLSKEQPTLQDMMLIQSKIRDLGNERLI